MNEPVDVHVGARIRIRRQQLGMTQAQLAEAVGVSWQQISKDEKGNNRTSPSLLVRISLALDVPVEYFFAGLVVGGGSRSRRTPFDDIAFASFSDGEVREMIGDFITLPTNVRRAISSVTRLMREELAEASA